MKPAATDMLGFDELSIEEKIEIVQSLWNRIAEESGAVLPTNSQREELDRRLEASDNRDDRSNSWSDVRARLRSKS
jgi:putative addiction module component (TIGR02574 family)